MCTALLHSSLISLIPNYREICSPVLFQHQLFLLISLHMQANLWKSLVFVRTVTSQTGELLRLNITQSSSLILLTPATRTLVLAERERRQPERPIAGGEQLVDQTAHHERSTDARAVSFNRSAQNICLSCLWNFTLISWFQVKGELIPPSAPNISETQVCNLSVSLLRNLELNRKHF